MPIYAFKCEQCEDEIELLVLTISDREKPTETPCKKCGGKMKSIIAGKMTRLPEKGKVTEDWKSWVNDLKRKNPGSDFTTF